MRGGRRVARAWLAVGLAGLPACGDDLPDPVPITGDADGASSSSSGAVTTTTGEPATSTTTGTSSSSDEGGSTSTTGHTTVGVPDECTASAQCGDGEVCVAPFDQSAGPEGKGAYACVVECVVIMDEDRWCADAAACCDPLAECTDRGYCVLPGETTDGGSSDGGSSGGGSSGGTAGR